MVVLRARAARMLVFSVLATVFGGLAHAAPQRVAVINMAARGSAGAEAATRIRGELDRRAGFDPVPAGNLADALERALPPNSSEQEKLASAQNLLREAREAYASRGAHEEALDGLRAAQSRLASIPPEPEVRALLAEISIDIGVVALAIQDRPGALESFRLARLLDPASQGLDPAVYDPEVVKLYAEAGKPRAPTASLSIVTDYDDATIWIDGAAVQGRTAELPPGIHVVTAAYPDCRPDGRRVTLTASTQPHEVTLAIEPLPPHERAEAMRRRLLADPAGGYLEAARAAADFTGNDQVVVVRTTADGKAEAALWERARNKLGHWLPIEGDRSVGRLLAPLLPRVQPPGGGRLVIPITPPPEPKWWQRNDVRVGGATAIILGTIITAAVLIGGDAQQNIPVDLCPFGC